jgi:cytochrome b561
MLHRSTGVTIVLLTLVRLRVRSHAVLPEWPPDLPHWQRFVAWASEIGLYFFLLAQPAFGIIGSLLQGKVVLFGIPIPQLLPRNRALARDILEVHWGVGLCLLALIALHVAAALHHHFVRRDDVLMRMLPAMPHVRRSPLRRFVRRSGMLP